MKPALCTGFANWRLKPREAKGYFANTVEKGMKLNEKKRESYLNAWKESKGAGAGMPGSPGVGTRKVIHLCRETPASAGETVTDYSLGSGSHAFPWLEGALSFP